MSNELYSHCYHGHRNNFFYSCFKKGFVHKIWTHPIRMIFLSFSVLGILFWFYGGKECERGKKASNPIVITPGGNDDGFSWNKSSAHQRPLFPLTSPHCDVDDEDWRREGFRLYSPTPPITLTNKLTYYKKSRNKIMILKSNLNVKISIWHY